jgi:hypothetical protein
MNAHRDPDRLINAFLMEGQTQLADPVYDAVRATIEQKRQRVVFGPWRLPDIMNKFVPLGLGAAAVVLVLVVGTQLLRTPASDGGVGGAPSTTPSATPSPSAEPSVAGPSASADTGLPVGSAHVLIDRDGVRGTVTVPAPGWGGDSGIMAKNDNVDPPDGAGMITFTGELYVFGDPCEWSTTKPETPARTVDELVVALSAQASRDASAPVDITVGGHAGKSITLHVPDDAAYSASEFTDCDQGFFGSWGVDSEPTPSRHHQGPGQIDELWILDVDGVLTVIDTAYYAGTPVEHVDEIRAIVESTTFE